ncbi:Erv1 / Alr family [Chrysochromulina ericina virus CeV-01B]|uniref:Sulfhydryl oxidase n=1 Tax=Chrysochromulina ericina virus CeV-01B TaxID=3070830 RepID=A0A0N9R3C7_9VIRU|nr:Erv1 / Alr family [Chrysochromulina ericina virus]ALH23120.1 Erv1 / Alr family [Chrysochromulina ericina virus CeV-01B]
MSLGTKKRDNRVFTKKNYMSGDGMLTTVWGPSMWHYLHTMSFNYPIKPTNEDKKHYRNFILSLQYVLPCKYCRINLKNNLKHNPIRQCDMKNRETFSRYVYKLHEIINKILKKKSNLTYCDVRERYENFRSRCTDDIKILKDENKLFKFKKNKTKKEKGCTEPLYGKKAKCVINIVPQDHKGKTINIDSKCIKRRTLKK